MQLKQGNAPRRPTVEVAFEEGGFWTLWPVDPPVFVPVTPLDDLSDHALRTLRERAA